MDIRGEENDISAVNSKRGTLLCIVAYTDWQEGRWVSSLQGP